MVLKCPVCKSEKVVEYMGGQFGKWQCKKCGYIGVIVIEEKNLKKREKINSKKHSV